MAIERVEQLLSPSAKAGYASCMPRVGRLPREHDGQVVLDPQVDIELQQVGPGQQRSHVRVEMPQRNAELPGPLDLCPQLDFGLVQFDVEIDRRRCRATNSPVGSTRLGTWSRGATGPQR